MIVLIVVVSFEVYFLFQYGYQLENPSPTPTSIVSPTPIATPVSSTIPSPSASPTPIPTATAVPKAIGNSQNWAGYAILSNLTEPQPVVTGVSGSWIVPSVEASGRDTFSGVWIGVGGYGSDETLVQAGTEQDSVRGLTSYSAWFEILPAQHVSIPQLSIGPGHQVQASISLVDPFLNQWTIDLVDVSTGQDFHRTLVYNSSRSSAEWIIERPTINNAISSLANFGNATFSGCKAVVENRSGAINSFPNIKFSMFQRIRPATAKLVNVSDLDSTGTEFTLSYLGG
jgi:hypothetical protein